VKKILILLVLTAVVAGGLYYTFTDKSYEYYDRAKKLYDEGKYLQANDLLETGLRINQHNRKIISLKGKVYPIVEGQKNYKEAKELYEEAINLALNGRREAAKLAMSRAYDLAYKVSKSSLVRDEAQDLIKKIARDAPLVLDSSIETQYKNAIKFESEGNLVRAYEALNYIEVKNEKTKRKLSELAFRIGEERFKDVSGKSAANEHLVSDALYWYSQVQPFDERYMKANERINELKLMKTK